MRHGVVDPALSRLPWRERSALLAVAAREGFDRLARQYELIVVEGAGSPAEINLAAQDYVNLGVARWAAARGPAAAVLVSDIDRGGSFAHCYGTWALLPQDLRELLQGFVFNRFRGDAVSYTHLDVYKRQSFAWAAESDLVWAIRAPRSVGALLTGALLGLAGALAQGLFRNPLADPYLLGSAAGAGLGVVLVLAAGGLLGEFIGLATAGLLLRTGLVGAAFAGALGGVALTLVLARGTSQPLVLLLAGVVVGVLLSAVSELVTLASPEALSLIHI